MEKVKENILIREPLSLRWLVLGALSCALAAFALLAAGDLLPEPLTQAAEPTSFIAENAHKHLVTLTSIGPRVAGSYENEVLAVGVLVGALREIAAGASPHHILEIDVHTASGAFSLSFLDGMNNVYRDVQSVVARLSARGGRPPPASRRNALLINCHFDTVPDSPGASDDGAGCAVGLETLRALAAAPAPHPHDVLLLLNGAEENIMQASHAFITTHKWAPSVRAFINVEACGAGGREVLFQAGPHDPWIMEVYAHSVPHPFASSLAQEIFESGLIPADTDFRVFRDFGNLSGVDLAWSANGYVYHTRLDTADRAPPSTLQRTGDNVLALAKGLLQSGRLSRKVEHTSGQPVFFDALGVGVVLLRSHTAVAVAIAAVAAAVLRVKLHAGLARDELYMKPGEWPRLVVTALARGVLGALCGLGWAAASGAGLHMLSPLAFYSHPWLLAPLYAVPAVAVAWLATLRLTRRCAPALRGPAGGARARLAGDALCAAWAALLLLCTLRALRSGLTRRCAPALRGPAGGGARAARGGRAVRRLGRAAAAVHAAGAALGVSTVAVAWLATLRLTRRCAPALRGPAGGARARLAGDALCAAWAALLLLCTLRALRSGLADAAVRAGAARPGGRGARAARGGRAVRRLGRAAAAVHAAGAALGVSTVAVAWLATLRLTRRCAPALRGPAGGARARLAGDALCAAWAALLLLCTLRALRSGGSLAGHAEADAAVRAGAARPGGRGARAARGGRAVRRLGRAAAAVHAAGAALGVSTVAVAWLATLRLTRRCAPALRGPAGGARARLAGDALCAAWAALLLLCMLRALRSGFLPALWTVGLATSGIVAYSLRLRGGAALLCWSVGAALPALQTGYVALDALAMFVPIMGRAGPVPHDIVMGVISASLAMAACCWLLPLVAVARKPHRLAAAMLALQAVTFAAVLLTPLGNPYSPTRPQRLMVFHTRRTDHVTGKQENLFWMPDLDSNSPHSLDPYVAAFKSAVATSGAECLRWVYCGAPYYLPARAVVPRGHAAPAPAPPLTTLDVQLDLHRNPDVLTMNVTGPSHVVVILSPVEGVKVSHYTASGAGGGVPETAEPWGSRETYFLALHDARLPAPWHLTFDLELEDGASPPQGAWVDISVAGHSQSGPTKEAPALKELLASLPPHAAPAATGWGVDLHLYRV
ncbi:endoplasmic reticulum metallopeptidase 1-like [Cydia pomonella]|uniref:endoplasmic reticulum metallopeptidase 1-like n=1 Tax=Cydia pomonella TaxID=82600 RepID=UPI002ADDADF2|nr:endoplasmic reticulum metallopeptidase 1-like [Cydia pomonella]